MTGIFPADPDADIGFLFGYQELFYLFYINTNLDIVIDEAGEKCQKNQAVYPRQWKETGCIQPPIVSQKIEPQESKEDRQKKVSAFYQKYAEKDGRALQAYLVEDNDHDYTSFKGYERDER